MMQCSLDRPAVPEATGAPGPDGHWIVDLDLDDRQADGLACIRCGGLTGATVPVGWVTRPPELLDRLGVERTSERCQIVAHDECQVRRPQGVGDRP